MKKLSQIKDQIIITITLIAIFGILVLSVIWLANNDPKHDPRLDADAEADYHQSVRRYKLMDDYMEILHIKGEYTIEDDVVTFQGREQEGSVGDRRRTQNDSVHTAFHIPFCGLHTADTAPDLNKQRGLPDDPGHQLQVGGGAVLGTL